VDHELTDYVLQEGSATAQMVPTSAPVKQLFSQVGFSRKLADSSFETLAFDKEKQATWTVGLQP